MDFSELSLFGQTIAGIWLVLAFFVWIFMVLLPASVARKKGHSFILFFLLSIFFFWITLFVVIFLDDRTLAKTYDLPDTES